MTALSKRRATHQEELAVPLELDFGMENCRGDHDFFLMWVNWSSYFARGPRWRSMIIEVRSRNWRPTRFTHERAASMDTHALQAAIRLIEEQAAKTYWDFATSSSAERDHPMANSIETILWQYRHSVRTLSELLSAVDRAADTATRMHAVDYVGCNYRVVSQFSEQEPFRSFLAIFQDSAEPENLRDRVRWWLERITPTTGPSIDDAGTR